jgi:hypothetical protein
MPRWQKRLQPGRANRGLLDASGAVARNLSDALARHGLGIGSRRDEQPVLAQRRDEIFRNLGKQTLDDHPVEGAYFRRDRQAIAKNDPGVGDGEPREARLASIARLLNRSMESTSRASRASNAVA